MRSFLTIAVYALQGLRLLAAASPSRALVDVVFPAADGLMLEGTLRLPASDQWPVPGVVLIHGSGPISRESILSGQLGMIFGFTIPVFAEIGVALQESGIAVLTYDKRSCGTFNGCSNNSYPIPSGNLTIDTFVEDALAAVAYLQSREEVSPDSVVAVGHSQSGQFIPVLLESNPDLMSGVMLAGAYRPIDEMLSYQLDYILGLFEKLGVNKTEALANPGVAMVADMAQGVASIRAGTSDEPVSGSSAAFWRSWFDLREEALLAAANIDQPLLFLNGEVDTNVPPSEAYAWKEYLTQVGADFEINVLSCVTHALNCLSETDMTKITPADIGREVDHKVHDALIDFVFSSTSVSSSTSSGASKRWNTREYVNLTLFVVGTIFAFIWMLKS